MGDGEVTGQDAREVERMEAARVHGQQPELDPQIPVGAVGNETIIQLHVLYGLLSIS